MNIEWISDDLLELWRAIVLGIGAFVMGLAAYIGVRYLQAGVGPSSPYRHRRHVLAIVVSYLLVVGTLEGQILHRAIDRDPATYRLPISSVAFPLGAYALLQLVRGRVHAPRKEEP